MISKYRVSIPKALAEKVGIQIGDELEWQWITDYKD